MSIKGMIIAIIFVTLGFTLVSLEIKNVNLTAGTLDIYMTNTTGCSYCENSIYNNNTIDWQEKKQLCELQSTWVAYDPITEEECAEIPGFMDNNGGWLFNGLVSGFQFVLTSIDITGASGGSASAVEFTVSTVGINVESETTVACPNPPCTFDSQVLAFSFDGATIPVGSDVLLTQISFSNYDNTDICFGEDTGSAGLNAISDVDGGYIAADWGECYCGSASENDADGDNICNGDDTCPYDEDNDADGDGVCGDADNCAGTAAGTAVDANGCPDLSISQVGNSLPSEFSITQNFPNPFNPVTSITFDVAEMDEISLMVYDLTGKEVITLVSGSYTPGTYNVEWNAVNNVGDGIVSGMYIYRYINSEKAITRKMLYLK